MTRRPWCQQGFGQSTAGAECGPPDLPEGGSECYVHCQEPIQWVSLSLYASPVNYFSQSSTPRRLRWITAVKLAHHWGVCLQQVQVLHELQQQVQLQVCKCWSRCFSCQATVAQHFARILVSAKVLFLLIFVWQNSSQLIVSQGNQGHHRCLGGPGGWGRWGGGGWTFCGGGGGWRNWHWVRWRCSRGSLWVVLVPFSQRKKTLQTHVWSRPTLDWEFNVRINNA